MDLFIKNFLQRAMGVYDKPARAAITCAKLCAGYSGCIVCLQKGVRLKTDSGLFNLF